MRPSSVRGTIRAPPSKSYTHRAFLLAALSAGPCRIENVLLSEDTQATLSGLEALGAKVLRSGSTVRIACPRLLVPDRQIDARNSGTTLRLLSGVASLLEGRTMLTGDESLRKRPMGPLLDALSQLGATARSLGGDGRPPVEIAGPIHGGRAVLPGSVSSQFLSSLLVACPLAHADSEVQVTPPIVSEPYVEITEFMLGLFGAAVRREDRRIRIPGGQRYLPRDFTVPGDFSSAAFPLAAAAVTRGDVTVEGLDPAMPQGDRRIADLLTEFGADVGLDGRAVHVQGSDLHGRTVDLGATPDLFPVLAVLATQAEGESRFVNGAHLRLKESDRIASTAAFLRAMGSDIQETDDGCVVHGPTRLRAATVDAQGDHRILMAAAVGALGATGPVEISDPESFRVSYPAFLDDFRALGAAMEVVP